MDTVVQLENVFKRYDGAAVAAIDDVSLRVEPGEAVAIMGPSGSGKSTLLNLIAGMDKPTSGAVRVGDERVDMLSEAGAARFRRRQVGMIFQFFNLLDDMTVVDNVLLPAQLAGSKARDARQRADELLDALRIAHRRDAYPARLSGGERQRVAIARALVNRPSLLLADEPTGAVDTATGDEIGRLLLDLNAKGQTLIVVTHSPELAQRYARRVVHIADGRVASDTPVIDGTGARSCARSSTPPAAAWAAGASRRSSSASSCSYRPRPPRSRSACWPTRTARSTTLSRHSTARTSPSPWTPPSRRPGRSRPRRRRQASPPPPGRSRPT